MTLATKLWSPKWWLVDGWWFDLDPASGWWMDSTTEAANKILSSAQTREKCLKIFQCRIVASRARFWDIQRLIQRASKNSKKNTCLDGATNHQEFSESWHIMMHHHESNVFSQVRFPIGGVCFATPEPQILTATGRVCPHSWPLQVAASRI